MEFRGIIHRTRFLEVYHKCKKTPELVSAVYILTSDEELWSRTQECLSPDSIDFSKTRIRGISTAAYTLYMAARDLYKGSDMLSIYAMTDSVAVPPRVVSIIDSALLIRRSDYEVFDRLLRGPQTQNPGSDTV